MKRALLQFEYLWYELKLMNNVRWWRWVSCWFSASFWMIASYRIDRFFYLLLGTKWSAVRILLLPLMFSVRPWIRGAEIHYRADIGKGMLILHPALGVVVSGKAVCGENLVLTGGNCIGARPGTEEGAIRLGNNVSLGANAVILGPVIVGNNVRVGAGAVVVKDAPDNAVLVGVPAHPIGTDATVLTARERFSQ